MNVIKLTDLDVSGKRVFIRADLNVPQDEAGNITEDTRIRASLPSIKVLPGKGAAVMVTSHLGRPTEGQLNHEDSLTPGRRAPRPDAAHPVRLITDWVDGGFEVKPGEVVLLENCRVNKGEKKNNDELAQKMASCATSTSMTPSAPPTAPKPPPTASPRYAPVACAGMLMGAEIDALSKALHNPKRPLVAIVGGSKVSSKLTILVAGRQGRPVDRRRRHRQHLPARRRQAHRPVAGRAGPGQGSPRHHGHHEGARRRSAAADRRRRRRRSFRPGPRQQDSGREVHANDRILDVGPKTAPSLAEIIANAGTVVWNGPVGVFELPQFAGGTKMMASAIAHPRPSPSPAAATRWPPSPSSTSPMTSVTSRPAAAPSLEFLEGKTLPAIAILEERGQIKLNPGRPIVDSDGFGCR